MYKSCSYQIDFMFFSVKYIQRSVVGREYPRAREIRSFNVDSILGTKRPLFSIHSAQTNGARRDFLAFSIFSPGGLTPFLENSK